MDTSHSEDTYQKDNVGPEDCMIGGIAFVRRQFRPTGYQSNRIERQEDSGHLCREMRS